MSVRSYAQVRVYRLIDFVRRASPGVPCNKRFQTRRKSRAEPNPHNSATFSTEIVGVAASNSLARAMRSCCWYRNLEKSTLANLFRAAVQMAQKSPCEGAL